MESKIRDRKIWDCDSSLYDSFELTSFKNQLDSAIHLRSLSMPRLQSDPLEPNSQMPKKKNVKIVVKLRKLIRSLFRSNNKLDVKSRGACMRAAGLSAIPEESVNGVDFLDLKSTVRKTLSERFTLKL